MSPADARPTHEPVRWGILGTGKIARILAGALAAAEDGELIGVGSREAARAKEFAAEVGAPRPGDYAAVIDDPDVDVVYVAVPHPFHRMWAVAAADAGKHVLCEKPLAVTQADAAAIVDAARGSDVLLLEAFAYRSHPQTSRLVELLREERIGQIRMIDAVFGYDAGPAPTNYLLTNELGGGSILDVGCYTTSMAHLVAATARGASFVEATEVSGSGFIGPTGVDHSAAGTVAFDGGLLARVACSIQANLDNAVRIDGTEGRITIPSPWLPGRIGSEARILIERRGTDAESIELPLDADVYSIEVDAVNASIRKGERTTTMMPWEDSLANMRTLDRWRTSVGLRYPDDGIA